MSQGSFQLLKSIHFQLETSFQRKVACAFAQTHSIGFQKPTCLNSLENTFTFKPPPALPIEISWGCADFTGQQSRSLVAVAGAESSLCLVDSPRERLWLAGRLAGRLAVQLAGRLAVQLAGRLADRLAGWLAGPTNRLYMKRWPRPQGLAQ